MKETLLFLFAAALSTAAFAAPTTQTIQNSRPTTPQTTAVQYMPRTNPIATPSQPVTRVNVLQPVTTASAQQPKTPTAVVASAEKGGNQIGSGGNYASYKSAKTLAPTEAATPKAAKLGKGESGLGKDQKAAQKSAEAAASAAPKADSAQPALQDVLSKTKMPDNVMSLLKQRNFEAANAAKHGK